MPSSTDWYDANAPTIAHTYESLEADRLNAWMADLLPTSRGAALDVGAGSGRDAAWLALRGLDVVAVEPSNSMREQAISLHPSAPVRWLRDALPDLREVLRTGLVFDVILLSAVWMHVAPADRARAFRKLVSLMKPGGMLAITLRIGPPDAARVMYPVTEDEVEQLARANGAFVERKSRTPDELGRAEISWVQIVVRLPDDGTGALPLLRHVILDDDKSSTYKLGLLRVLGRIADGAAGYARRIDDERVGVPLGLVALYWLRLYKPLLAANLPQLPTQTGMTGLGFVGEAYRQLSDLSHLNLRVGMSFTGERAAAVHTALRDAAATIRRMPATYLTYPNGGPVFPVQMPPRVPRHPPTVTLENAYLASFGELTVPSHLWRAMQRFDAWIEPAVIAEWIRLMKQYATRQGRSLDEATIIRAMTWADPARDTLLAREQALRAMNDGPLHCVWTGKALNQSNLDIDHCFPWSSWPCDHLWNLMPAQRQVNQHQKRDRLPSHARLRDAHERILAWWDRGYRHRGDVLDQRFVLEARSSLPSIPEGPLALDDVFAGVMLQRIRLRQDQGVPEWEGPDATKGSAAPRQAN